MDIDLLKPSSSEEEMELMLMLQMDKISEFAGESPMMDFSAHGSTSSTNNNNGSATMAQQPTFTNLPFSGSPRDPSTYPFSSSGELTGSTSFSGNFHHKNNSVAAMREMIFRIAAMQPIHIDPESVKPPKRRNVKISKDPQSVAARHRREKISEKIRILQRLVPGGTKMDTASMLDEAIHYVKFLKNQVQSLERAAATTTRSVSGMGFPVPMTSGSYLSMAAAIKGYQAHQNVQHYADA